MEARVAITVSQLGRVVAQGLTTIGVITIITVIAIRAHPLLPPEVKVDNLRLLRSIVVEAALEVALLQGKSLRSDPTNNELQK